MDIDSGLGCEFVSWLKLHFKFSVSSALDINMKTEDKEHENKKNTFLDWKTQQLKIMYKSWVALDLRGGKHFATMWKILD